MESPRETVVVVHGFGGKRLWMAPLAYRLSRKYDVANWSYFSFGGSIENHGRRFAEFIESLNTKQKINIVAHSMGSIVTRAALQNSRTKISRVVMLAPPNAGSHVARFVSPVLGTICRPIREISSHKDSYVNQLPIKSPCETGVIASKFDVLVPWENTMLDGLADHQTVVGTHNSLLFSGKVAAMVVRFFRHGKFAASPDA